MVRDGPLFFYRGGYLFRKKNCSQAVVVAVVTYYLNNIMEKVIPKSKTKFLQNFF